MARLKEGAALGRQLQRSSTKKMSRGFSLTEVVVTIAVMLILTGMAIPTLLRAYEAYRFNNSATQLAGILKLTRFEAIRRNRQIACQIQQVGTDWLIWVDTNGNRAADANEQQYQMTGSVSLLPAGTPPAPDAITASLGVGSLTELTGGIGSVAFDARGAVVPVGGAQPPVYVLYVGNGAAPELGYRAVVLLPSGVVHVWTAGTAGPWQQVS
jgi:prepilin-type N-terminal cleavage/methylation domain-containing protein